MATYKENAENFELWAECVDPHGTITESEFDAMSIEEKIKIQVDCFGPQLKPVCGHVNERGECDCANSGEAGNDDWYCEEHPHSIVLTV